jgi:hypothetical protein
MAWFGQISTHLPHPRQELSIDALPSRSWMASTKQTSCVHVPQPTQPSLTRTSIPGIRVSLLPISGVIWGSNRQKQQKINELTDEWVVGHSGQHETPGKRFVNDLFYGIRTGHVQITFLSLLMGHARLLLLRPVFCLQIISGGIVKPPAGIIYLQDLRRFTTISLPLAWSAFWTPF